MSGEISKLKAIIIALNIDFICLLSLIAITICDALLIVLLLSGVFSGCS